ncbi:MAG: hypothetical protein MUC47_01875 [Candidatus Kapabacteria bacterium]|jgi:hypothetical protein|nr:hypothetical protein [Candidatus Kapabacteria bacterium]
MNVWRLALTVIWGLTALVACDKQVPQEAKAPDKQQVQIDRSALRPVISPVVLEQLRRIQQRRDSTRRPDGVREIDTSYGRPIIDYTDADVVWLSDRVKRDNPAMFAQCIVPRWNAFCSGAELIWPNYTSLSTVSCTPLSMLVWRSSESQRLAWRATSQAVREKFMTSLGQYVLGTNMPANTRLVITGLDYGSLNVNPYDSVTTSIMQFPESGSIYTIVCHRVR